MKIAGLTPQGGRQYGLCCIFINCKRTFVYAAITPGESVTPINDHGGFIVGAFDSAQYDTGRMTLKPGSTVVLCTDGVSEANNLAEDEYSPERLEACLASSTEQSAEGLVREVISDVRTFTAGAVQSDDLTMLALKYMG